MLSCLADGAELTSAEIARAVFVRPQSMSDVLDGMERRGLVRRVGVRARGRRNPAAITPAGQAVLDAVQKVALATNDLSSLGLDASRSAQLAALMLAVIEGAEAAPELDDGS
ncbi:hypothetical protein ASG28_01975 [Frigoribacterium sp. Leaf415]|nr:hypothetical protein ASF07_01975 [Frigoribacterium sp. Leaf254]KQT38613.1 hypothetical protein ASG28_01975 [Frigoribacterium sp. Leaf415]